MKRGYILEQWSEEDPLGKVISVCDTGISDEFCSGCVAQFWCMEGA
jgi:hypothetical protein